MNGFVKAVSRISQYPSRFSGGCKSALDVNSVALPFHTPIYAENQDRVLGFIMRERLLLENFFSLAFVKLLYIFS